MITAASVGEKGLGHGNKRNKLNVNIIDDQDSYPKEPPAAKVITQPRTPVKPR